MTAETASLGPGVQVTAETASLGPGVQVTAETASLGPRPASSLAGCGLFGGVDGFAPGYPTYTGSSRRELRTGCLLCLGFFLSIFASFLSVDRDFFHRFCCCYN